MKKYLMTGVAALAICAAFTSCSKGGDELYDQGAIDKQKELSVNEKYVAAFEKAFGKVGSNVDWGFSSNAATRSTQKEYHRWAELGLSMPTALTEDERRDVTRYFATTPFSDTGIALNWTEYYVEWVSNVTETSAYRNEGSQAGDMGNVNITFDRIGVESTSQWSDNGYEDILDWNASTHPTYYMYETVGTGKFRAWISYASKWNTKYTIQEYKGNFYVAFDIDVTKDSDGRIDLGKKTAGYYNDYIIRLIPGKNQPIPNTHLYRVIAEDLSASDDSDFDFNDVVFDVIGYDGATNKTTLRLQACGGTLPLKVGSTGGVNGVEVHSLYGDNASDATTGKYKMWNTGQNSHAAVDFTVDGKYTTPEELLNLRIEVCKDDVWMPLTAQRGVAACKILVDDRFPIVPERHSIANKQGNFTTYVSGNWKTNSENFWWVQN
jgi:hypothetical protein